MIYIFLGFLCAVIGAALTSFYYEKKIDEWSLLYNKCECELLRLYKVNDELWDKLMEAKG